MVQVPSSISQSLTSLQSSQFRDALMQDWLSIIQSSPQHLSLLDYAQLLSIAVRHGVLMDLPCCLSSTHVFTGLGGCISASAATQQPTYLLALTQG